MFTANQLIAHLVGDYFLQSDWMATNKFTKKKAALTHVIVYTIPFLFLTFNPFALFFIAATHYFIDHYKLAWYVVWGKNFISPPGNTYPLSMAKHNGFKEGGAPDHIGDWIYIITDNTMHLLCNGFAIGVIATILVI